MTPEKRIQNKILRYLKTLEENDEPIFYERRQAGGFSYKKGIPDIYVVYYGRHIEIEVKAENGSTSTMQDKFAERCDKCMIRYICVKSADDVKCYLESLKTKLLDKSGLLR